jgi:hypothetical protein
MISSFSTSVRQTKATRHNPLGHQVALLHPPDLSSHGKARSTLSARSPWTQKSQDIWLHRLHDLLDSAHTLESLRMKNVMFGIECLQCQQMQMFKTIRSSRGHL